jgi:hypothetical protein
LQPPLDIQQHPAAVGDRLDRTNHEVPRHFVEELLDVKIDRPVELPAPLPAPRERIMGRLTRPIAIGVLMKPRFHQRLHVHRYDRLRATLSAIVGTPSTRTPRLCGLGISTALTGGGNQVPELIRFQIL